MKKSIKIAVLIVAVIVAGFGSVKTINYYSSHSKTILDENVEAYTQLYYGQPIETGSFYSVWHSSCASFGSTTQGKYYAWCMKTVGGTKSYHGHGCIFCDSAN